MPTFSTPTPEAPVAAATAFAPPPADSVRVIHFREATPAHLDKLNCDLGLSLDTYRLSRLQGFFRNIAKRDPTVGELRLLNGLDAFDQCSPRRMAVGELITESDAVAAAWADMMATHGCLHRVGETQRGKGYPAAPPCTLADALSLSGHYLYRTELKSPPRGQAPNGSLVLLSTPAQEAVAAAEGYRPVARVAVGEDTRSLWERRDGAPLRIPARTGDLILFIPDLTVKAVAALLKAHATSHSPVLGELRPVAGESLLSVLTDMNPGVELYADRIASLRGVSEAGRIPVELLCATPAPRADGTADYLARVPLKQTHALTEILRSLGLTATICGQVRTGERILIRIRNEGGKEDIPVTELPTSFLRATAAVYLHRFEVARQTKDPVAPALPRWARLPSPYAAEDGITARGQELTPLTVHEGQILAIPETDTVMSAVTLTLTEEGMGFASAADAAAEATDRLLRVGMDPAAMTLSVSLTVGDASLLTRGMTVEALCGVYRLAMDREIPVDDPAWIVGEGESGLRITVVAWGYAPHLREDPSVWVDRQWKASEKPIHKESPAVLLPCADPADMPALEALSHGLNRDTGVACGISPLRITVTEEEGCSRRAISEEDIRAFAEALNGWSAPILALSEEDTRLLLEQASIREALERTVSYGYPVIALGQSCRVLAEYGFLPGELTRISSLPASADTVTVTYTHPADAVTRILRAPLTAAVAAETLPHLLTLHMPDCTRIPDGFTGRDGRVLGLLNGMDTGVLQAVLDMLSHPIPS